MKKLWALPAYALSRSFHQLLLLILFAPIAPAVAFPQAKPDVLPDAATLFRRPVVPSGDERHWDFQRGPEGWRPLHSASIQHRNGAILIRVSGNDPYVASGEFAPLRGTVQLELRARTTDVATLELFWQTTATSRFHSRARSRIRLRPDGLWHTYRLLLQNEAPVTRLRLDPGSGPTGRLELDYVILRSMRMLPIEIVDVQTSPREVRIRFRNHDRAPREVVVQGRSATVRPGADSTVVLNVASRQYVSARRLRIQTPGFPPLYRTVAIVNPEAQVKWLRLTEGGVELRVHPQATAAELWYGGRRVATMAPLAARGGRVLAGHANLEQDSIAVKGEDFSGTVRLRKGLIEVSLTAPRPIEGPVLRLTGTVESAIFPGIEYLGRGEESSSTADIAGPEHIRFRPDPLYVTIPVMIVHSASGAASLSWEPSPDIQPVFLVPNRLDGPPGHRISLIGTRISAQIRVDLSNTDQLLLEAVRRLGLPPLPAPPRKRHEQVELCLRAINGVLWNGSGWGHCAEANWARRPFADFASTLFWNAGQLPSLSEIVPGGSHLRNDTIYFLTNRSELWLRRTRAQAHRLLQAQRPDGSYRYRGPLGRTHFEDTASGYCAVRAAGLLEAAYYTGDQEALRGGLRTLEYMKRFRTPRGAQTWEIPLHTPDILAAAHLVRAYVLGHRLTGNPEYRDLAVRWAVRGLPFVYLWSYRPMMAYATIAVYGATNWKAPVWIGRPVQWCGLVYAESLRLLAEHDETLNWTRIARGILRAAEQMQYPDGPFAGCLPDSIEISSQLRFGPAINPCAVLSLSRRLNGLPDHLSVLRAPGYVVVGPFPMVAGREPNTIQVRSRANVSYELMVNGRRVVPVQGTGRDVVRLSAE